MINDDEMINVDDIGKWWNDENVTRDATKSIASLDAADVVPFALELTSSTILFTR